MKKPSLKTTKDGSHTLYSELFNQHYHNPNGAVAESNHNFFESNGLTKALKERERINILEIGFGTGLNLLLLMDELLNYGSTAKITFHSIEAFPISGNIARQLNYADYIEHPELKTEITSLFEKLQKGMNSFSLLPNLSVHIFYGLFKNYEPAEISFDYIFHDAFSLDVNPDLWTGQVFQKLYNWSADDAILSTYCAASKAKGTMAWAGWKVARAKGALGKREMTIASPSAEPISHLKRINEERLAKRYEEGDF